MMNHLDHCYEIYTLIAEFNEETFVTYRKQILHTEIKIYTSRCSRFIFTGQSHNYSGQFNSCIYTDIAVVFVVNIMCGWPDY